MFKTPGKKVRAINYQHIFMWYIKFGESRRSQLLASQVTSLVLLKLLASSCRLTKVSLPFFNQSKVSHEQISFGCLQVFASFLIGLMLMSWVLQIPFE